MKKKLILILFIIIVLGAALYIGKDEVYKYLYPKKYSDYVEFYSKEYNIDEDLVYSIIKAESKFKKDAVSRRGAKGLMQIGDGTRDWAMEELDIKDADIFEPEDNIRIGCWYLNKLYREFGDIDLVIAAYNGGSGNVKKWLADEAYSQDGENLHTIPFKETSAYVEKVKHNYEMYKIIYN